MRYWLLFPLLLIFSFWLMFHTISYSPSGTSLLISANVWSDFASHLPQIRSFSLGDNWPPQYPLYPGQPTRYHFLFYAFTGWLEHLGFRFDYAVNLPSAFGFFLLLVLIWELSLIIFSDRRIGFLSVLFFLFNGSLSWIDYFKKYSLDQLIHLDSFVSFGPWNGSEISAFWNLNIYTNQRHLGLSFAIALLVVIILYSGRRRLLYLVGFLTGSFLLLNQAVLLISLLFIIWFFLFKPEIRRPLTISLLGALPWLFLSRYISPGLSLITFHPGFLSPSPLGPMSIFRFWFLNFGPHLFLVPLGMILAPRRTRVFVVPLLILFIVPNLFQLSADIINNHKLFNFFQIIGVMFSAFTLVKISRIRLFGRILSSLLFFVCVFGGIVDIFPVINDRFIPVKDFGSDPDARYFLTQTPLHSVTLNSTWLYHPASLAGRFIYNGYPYFTWSFGYDQVTRERLVAAVFSAPDKSVACHLLQQNHLDFVELSSRPESFIRPNFDLWHNKFVPDYFNPGTGLRVYSVDRNCRSI